MNIYQRIVASGLIAGIAPAFLAAPEAVKPIVNSGERVGRNQPCPCGSGRKFKRCHLPKAKANGTFIGRKKPARAGR